MALRDIAGETCGSGITKTLECRAFATAALCQAKSKAAIGALPTLWNQAASACAALSGVVEPRIVMLRLFYGDVAVDAALIAENE
jgi:hypothetical protein